MVVDTVDTRNVELNQRLNPPLREADIPFEYNKVPFSEAKVTIIEGEQGGGKSNTAVARVVNAYDKDCVAIFCREVLKISCIVKSYNRTTRIAKIKYNGLSRLIRIPPQYKLHSPLQIHCNFHLYGLPFFYYKSFWAILDGLKAGKIKDGYLVVDEYYIGGNARESMTALGKELEKQSFQYRKMQLNVIIVTPMAKLIDWTLRVIPTEHISCTYDKRTRKITLQIKKKGEKGVKEVTYLATQYWRNFWTNERINE
jgi:hypothetical protein